jgi:TPR repeat protein
MTEALSSFAAIIRVVQGIVDNYQRFQAFDSECLAFRELLMSVLEVLKAIEKEFTKNANAVHNQNTTFTRPLSLLRDAVNQGEKALEMCCKKKGRRQVLIAFALGKEWLGQLTEAKGKINEALTLLSTTDILLSASIKDDVDDVRDALATLDKKLTQQTHEVASTIKEEFRRGGNDMADRIIQVLKHQGVVMTMEDYKDQMKKLEDETKHLMEKKQRHADVQSKFAFTKTFYDEEIMKMVLALSLHGEPKLSSLKNSMHRVPTASSSLPQSTIDAMLECGIMKARMEDPVFLIENGRRYDRKHICKWLLHYPNKDPLTAALYDKPLTYVTDYEIRTLLTETYGDRAFIGYDDKGFPKLYAKIWRINQLLPFSNRFAKRDIPEFTLGTIYYYGKGLPQDCVEAFRQFVIAADQGSRDAQFHLGRMYSQGKGVHKDENQSFGYYEAAAQQGHAKAQCNLGVMYENGRGVLKNCGKAVYFYKLAAEQELASAQCNLGIMYKHGRGVTQDLTKTVTLFTLAAGKGYAPAHYCLGLLYKMGSGVSQDYSKAIAHYKLAANQGYSKAQCNLGVMYEKGLGVHRDDEQAVRYYNSAANQSHAIAQCNLAIMYGKGKGVRKDFKKAATYYQLSADRGHTNAQYCLGFSFYIGKGVNQDYAKAMKYYKLAADKGHAKAQFKLGRMYKTSQGMARDYGEAQRYLMLAAEQGRSDAQLALSKLQGEIANNSVDIFTDSDDEENTITSDFGAESD